MNTDKLSVLVSILVVTIALVIGTGCKTEQKATKAVSPPLPQIEKPQNVFKPIPVPDFVMHGVAVKTDDAELGLIIFQGDAGPTRPGLVITLKEQLAVGTPVEVFFGNLFILDGDRPGKGQNCLHVRIARRTSASAQAPLVPFRAQMFAETIFSGSGTVVKSDKNLGIIATQNDGAERADLPALFIDELPSIEKNDPVTCTIRQVRMTLNGLPGKPTHSGFRITVTKLPGKMTGERVAQNTAPR